HQYNPANHDARACRLVVSALVDDTAVAENYTLSLHDALPIFDEEQLDPKRQLFRLKSFSRLILVHRAVAEAIDKEGLTGVRWTRDRKSTRLNSSHVKISYAVFCLKKKNREEVDEAVHAICVLI